MVDIYSLQKHRFVSYLHKILKHNCYGKLFKQQKSNIKFIFKNQEIEIQPDYWMGKALYF